MCGIVAAGLVPQKVVLYYWAFIGDTLKIHEEKQKDLSYFLKK
jgi:hypothetical protein